MSVCNADIRVCVWLGKNTSAVVVTCSDTRLTALRADVSRSDSPQPSSSLHPGRVCVTAHTTQLFLSMYCLCVWDTVLHWTIPRSPQMRLMGSLVCAHTYTRTFSLVLLHRVVVYWFRWSVLFPLCILELIIPELLPQASLLSNLRSQSQTWIVS